LPVVQGHDTEQRHHAGGVVVVVQVDPQTVDLVGVHGLQVGYVVFGYFSAEPANSNGRVQVVKVEPGNAQFEKRNGESFYSADEVTPEFEFLEEL